MGRDLKAQLVINAMNMAMAERPRRTSSVVAIRDLRAVSTGRRNMFTLRLGQQFVQGLGGCLPFQRLSRSPIQRASDGLQLIDIVQSRSVPLGKYWRSRPLVFSFVPRCHGLCGSQK